MSLVLQLSSQLERRLQAAASLRQIKPEELATALLESHVPQEPSSDKPKVRPLQQWRIDHPDVTGEDDLDYDIVLKNIDAGRESYRQLYPDELKGITW